MDGRATRPRILLVILHHVLTVPAVLGGTTPAWHSVMGGLEPFRIPLLLTLSGMLLPQSLAKPLRTYYLGKVHKVLWPFIVWTLITCIALQSAASLLSPWTWVGGSWHLWFLAVLLACYLVGPLTRWVPAWLWVIPMVGLSPIPDTNAFARILWFGAFFFLGAAIARHAGRWQAVRPLLPVVMLAAAMGFAVWVALPFGEYTQRSPLAFVASVVGILAIVWLAPRTPRLPFLATAGRQSLVLYLVHFPAIGVTYLLVGDVSWWLLFPALSVVGYGLPLALSCLSQTVLFEFPKRLRPRRP